MTTAGATALGYDGRGNLISSGSSSYDYTSENRLATTGSGAYLANDAIGRLVQVYANGGANVTPMDYDGQNLITEMNGSNVLIRRYVHGPGSDEPLVWYEGAGTTDRRWLHADERGSVIAISNGSGTVTNINAYDEYGIPASNNVGRFGYTGQTWLPEVGLYYYKARLYSPTLGRFMQTDPIGYGDGMNIYNYVGSDPVNGRDPTGLDCVGYGCGENTVITARNPSIYIRVTPTPLRVAFEDNSGREMPCPDVPAEVPGYLYADPGAAISSIAVVAIARAAAAVRYPTLSGGDDARDAYRHVFGAATLARRVGGSRALGALNVNEFLGYLKGLTGAKGYTAAARRMDDYNNYVGVILALDPRFSNMSTTQIADYASRNGCLVTAP